MFGSQVVAFHFPVHVWNCINKVKKSLQRSKALRKDIHYIGSCKIILLHCK